jgi:Spy/CpxP family protein refolding chaperone
MIDPIAPDSRPGKGARRVLLGVALAAAFVAGGLTMPVATAAAFGMAMDQTGMGAMGPMHGHMHQMAEAHIDKMLAAVDATPDQKTRIKEILHRGMASIGPMHEKLAGAHGDLHRLLAAPTIDRAALEQLRSDRMADFDQASKVLVQTLADAADVLRPDQRAKLATMMAEHQHSHS